MKAFLKARLLVLMAQAGPENIAQDSLLGEMLFDQDNSNEDERGSEDTDS